MGELDSCVADSLVSLGHGRSRVLESVQHVSQSLCDLALCVRAGARTRISCSMGTPQDQDLGRTPTLRPE